MTVHKNGWNKLYEIAFFTISGLFLVWSGIGFIIMLLFTIAYFVQ
ncbi:hypothetical protein [Sporosarcina sp. YIM B06819]|nr:hypothetical protein [Sporosarcina sp. YIM B06819]